MSGLAAPFRRAGHRYRKDNTMTRIIALALALSLGGIAQASDYGKVDPAKAEAIKAMLTEQGYDVRRIKTEDGMYEAYAMKDGQRLEVYVNDDLEIVRTKADD
jgi:hypothetical protein